MVIEKTETCHIVKDGGRVHRRYLCCQGVDLVLAIDWRDLQALSHSIVIYLDNQSAITLANSEGQFHVRSIGNGMCLGSPARFTAQKHIFWTKTEGDMTDFIKFIEISPISFNSGPFWTFWGYF